MTAIEAIDRLIKAVKAGTGNVGPMAYEAGLRTENVYVFEAYNGSLDAAKALHEALLPGWDWCVTKDGASVYSPDDNSPFDCDGKQTIQARAWLLAILRAHRHQIAAGGE